MNHTWFIDVAGMRRVSPPHLQSWHVEVAAETAAFLFGGVQHRSATTNNHKRNIKLYPHVISCNCFCEFLFLFCHWWKDVASEYLFITTWTCKSIQAVWSLILCDRWCRVISFHDSPDWLFAFPSDSVSSETQCHTPPRNGGWNRWCCLFSCFVQSIFSPSWIQPLISAVFG